MQVVVAFPDEGAWKRFYKSLGEFETVRATDDHLGSCTSIRRLSRVCSHAQGASRSRSCVNMLLPASTVVYGEITLKRPSYRVSYFLPITTDDWLTRPRACMVGALDSHASPGCCRSLHDQERLLHFQRQRCTDDPDPIHKFVFIEGALDCFNMMIVSATLRIFWLLTGLEYLLGLA